LDVQPATPPGQISVSAQPPPSLQVRPPSVAELPLVFEQPEADRPTIASRRNAEPRVETRILLESLALGSAAAPDAADNGVWVCLAGLLSQAVARDRRSVEVRAGIRGTIRSGLGSRHLAERATKRLAGFGEPESVDAGIVGVSHAVS
jgi:hypothetical protein